MFVACRVGIYKENLLNSILFFVGIFVVLAIIGKIIEYFEDKKASKQIPEIRSKLETKELQLDYLKRKRKEVSESVLTFRSENERKYSSRPYYPTKKHRRRS